MVLIEPHFELGSAHSASVSRAPLNVEDSVGGGASDQRKYATVWAISPQVSLIRKNNSVQTIVRQRTRRAEIRLVAGKLQIAIGADVRLAKGLVVKLHWEWKRNLGKAIVAVIACVDYSGHDRARAAACDVLAASLHRRGSRRCGSGGGWVRNIRTRGGRG